jgi:hypothetical protein
VSDVVRIFVGTEPKTHIACKVLEHTIRKHASRPVDITPMIGPAWEYPIADIKVGTGFSLRRWMIPAACNWYGPAIYMDADQIVFGDVAELLDLGVELMAARPGGPAAIACTFQPDKYSAVPWSQTSVMVIDCLKAGHQDYWQFRIDEVLAWLRKNTGNQNYARLMHAEGIRIGEPLPVEWNHLNVYKEGVTKLLHYTKEPEQPWYKPDHALAYLWKKELVETLEAGEVTRADMEAALAEWGKKKDWRPTNGLHPHYRKFLASAKK